MTDNHLLLYRLAELMLQKEQHVLSVDDLFEDNRIGDFVKSIQIDSPYQQLLFEGVLTESVKEEKLYVSFTVEGYFHYVLGEVIYTFSYDKDAEFIIQLLLSNKLNGLKEGIEQCLIRDVNYQRMEKLFDLIDIGGDNFEICSRPLLHFIKSYGVATTLDKLLEKPTDNDWLALLELNELLSELQLQVLRKEFLTNMISRISFYNKHDTKLGLKAIEFIDDNQARIYFARILVGADYIQNDSEILESLGKCHERFGEYDKSLEYYEKCLEIQLKSNNVNQHFLANTYNYIGLIFNNKGDHEKALEYYEKCLLIIFKTKGYENLDVARTFHNVGLSWHYIGEYDKAWEYYEKCLAIQLKTLGRSHSYIAYSFNSLGGLWHAKGNVNKALEFYYKALSIRLNILGEKHQDIGNSYINIADTLKDCGDYENAIENYTKGLAIQLATLGNQHRDVANSYNKIGSMSFKNGDYDQSIENFENCIKIELKIYGPDHHSVAISYNNIGTCWKSKGDFNKAFQYFILSCKIFKEKYGLENTSTEFVMMKAKEVALKLGKESELLNLMN